MSEISTNLDECLPENIIKMEKADAFLDAHLERMMKQKGDQSFTDLVQGEVTVATEGGEVEWGEGEVSLGFSVTIMQATTSTVSIEAVFVCAEREEDSSLLVVAKVVSIDDNQMTLDFLRSRTTATFASSSEAAPQPVFDAEGNIDLYGVAISWLEKMSPAQKRDLLEKLRPTAKRAQAEKRLPRGNGMALAVVKLEDGTVWLGVHITNCNRPITKHPFPVAPFGFDYKPENGPSQSFDARTLFQQPAKRHVETSNTRSRASKKFFQ